MTPRMAANVTTQCCTAAQVPTVLCKGEHHCFYFRSGAAFPFDAPVPEPICAIPFCRLVPCKPAFMTPPFGGEAWFRVGAPPAQEMTR